MKPLVDLHFVNKKKEWRKRKRIRDNKEIFVALENAKRKDDNDNVRVKNWIKEAQRRGRRRRR